MLAQGPAPLVAGSFISCMSEYPWKSLPCWEEKGSENNLFAALMRMHNPVVLMGSLLLALYRGLASKRGQGELSPVWSGEWRCRNCSDFPTGTWASAVGLGTGIWAHCCTQKTSPLWLRSTPVSRDAVLSAVERAHCVEHKGKSPSNQEELTSCSACG